MYRHKFFVYLYQIHVWLLFIPSIAITVLVFGPITMFLNRCFSFKIGSIIPRLWGRWHCWITPAKIKTSGKEHILHNQSYIIVANHQSQYDILALMGQYPNPIFFIMKYELTKIPVFGWVSRNLGHVPINRGDSDSAKQTINDVKKKLVPGASIAFFPEGTRNVTGKLIPFKKGAFRLALDIQLPILPVSISGTKDILPYKSFFLFPGKAAIIFHKPIDVSAYTIDTIDELVDATRSVIQKGLDDINQCKK